MLELKCMLLGILWHYLLWVEIKVTDGIISSKTGFDGDITTYQISAPIQEGSSEVLYLMIKET